jgi:succinate dehydrogenase/fumarate reductase flavoprotein subunit
MERATIAVNGTLLPLYRCYTLIIGSGAAALNCAVHLNGFGVEDILIVTEQLGGGTSNNSGSDKQTYYKLSVFGEEPDSVYDMARTLFSGGAMHGDLALVEAALSTQEFFHLVQIGVPFPHNAYGGYVGYKTDHDPKQRATSAGPWTSNQMYAKLLEQVQKADIPILDGHEVIQLLTTADGERVIGAVAISKAQLPAGTDPFVVFHAENVVLGTGGPGGIYAASVYPEDHLGSTGVALAAGAVAANLTEWQYGLASVKFRWNVSGTYQQVIPRYISTAQDGSDPQEFLNPFFPSMGKLATAVFLKGYQWPFDPRKLANYGSSLIDLLVYRETVQRGRRVFLDFRSNPKGDARIGEFDFTDLEEEAYLYLHKSGALFGTPIERLQHMNSMAIELYRQHGIDLTAEPLEIAVCAQHNNGGLQGNIWWESNIKHLFPIGEANGSHGVYRPGGSALNSGQVGGYRAAEYIAEVYRESTFPEEEALAQTSKAVESLLELRQELLRRRGTPGRKMAEFRREMQQRMTAAAAHIRDPQAVKQAIREGERQYELISSGQVCLETDRDLLAYFQNKQLCLTHLAVLHSIAAYLDAGGGSRGSYLVVDPEGEQVHPELGEFCYRPENAALHKQILLYRYHAGKHLTEWEEVRPIPADDFWFETVWSAYVNKEIF